MEIFTVAVLGSGVMGQGIARVCAAAGLRTTIYQTTSGDIHSLTAKRLKFESELKKEVEKGKLSEAGLAAITHSLNWGTTSGDFWAPEMEECDLVIESIVEDLSKKQELFKLLDGFMKPGAIFASNTSTLSIANLARATGRLDRFIGLHFFNPVAVMKLVEVVKMKNTATEVLAGTEEFVRKLGKTPVFIGDTSGFVVNRLMMNSLLYAIRCWEDGVASMNDIDQCMKLGLGHPMGPFALCDLIGLDVVLAMATQLCSGLNDKRFAPPPILWRLINMGMLGRKTKAGFYDYTVNPPGPNWAMRTDTTDGM